MELIMCTKEVTNEIELLEEVGWAAGQPPWREAGATTFSQWCPRIAYGNLTRRISIKNLNSITVIVTNPLMMVGAG